MAEYYSIKMRASRGFRDKSPGQKPVSEHISGAERIVVKERIDDVSMLFIHRASKHEKGFPDFINLKIQAIDKDSIEYVASLPVFMIQVPDYTAARKACKALLLKSGISTDAIENGCEFLEKGYQDGRGLSGALVMDGSSSSILNPEGKGVRATTMDFTDDAHGEIDSMLGRYDLSHSRLKEALVLATKVAHAPYARAELCYSDNPDYHVGYVAIPNKGYFRIPHLKTPSSMGGRIFFVHGDNFSWDIYSRYLRNTPVFIDKISPFYMNLPYNKILSRFEQLPISGDVYE